MLVSSGSLWTYFTPFSSFSIIEFEQVNVLLGGIFFVNFETFSAMFNALIYCFYLYNSLNRYLSAGNQVVQVRFLIPLKIFSIFNIQYLFKNRFLLVEHFINISESLIICVNYQLPKIPGRSKDSHKQLRWKALQQ